MKALIDCDPLCYSVGSFTNPHPFLKDGDGKQLEMPVRKEEIEGLVDDYLDRIIKDSGSTEAILCLSSSVSTNFRDKVATTYPYKGRRDGSTRPYHHQTVVDHISSKLNVKIADNREADDDLADLCREDPQGTIICTIDKDLDGVEGLHYNWKSDRLYEVSEQEAMHFFYKQLLTGDWSTDCILGCAKLVDSVYGPKAKKAGQQYTKRVGVGPKRADEILSVCTTEKEYKEAVCYAYMQELGDKWLDQLNEMGRLLYMGGSEDKLWDINKEYPL